MSAPQVCVIGAGIVGVCSALWLQRRGFSVTLVDALGPGEGASSGNAGNISPGSVVPHLIPEVLRALPGWLLNAQGPVSVRPGHLIKALPWLLAAARSSERSRVFEVARAMHALHGGTIAAYEELTRDTPAAGLLERSGQLYVSELPHVAHGSELVQRLRAEAGVRTVALDWMEIRELEPALAPIFKSGLLLPDNARLKNPHQMVAALAAQAQHLGTTIRRGSVSAFDLDGGRLTGVIIDGTRHAVERVVVAAGAASGELSAMLGTRLPLEAERGYHITIADAGVAPRIPVMHCDSKFVAAPMNVGLRLAGTAEFAGLNAPPNWKRAEMLKLQAQRMFPGVRLAQTTRWMGSRPSLPDGLPVLGAAPGIENAWFAFGNSHFGMTAGPVMGKLVSAMIAGETPDIDVSPFGAERFLGRRVTAG